jgi:hypothetical protein
MIEQLKPPSQAISGESKEAGQTRPWEENREPDSPDGHGNSPDLHSTGLGPAGLWNVADA